MSLIMRTPRTLSASRPISELPTRALINSLQKSTDNGVSSSCIRKLFPADKFRITTSIDDGRARSEVQAAGDRGPQLR